MGTKTPWPRQGPVACSSPTAPIASFLCPLTAHSSREPNKGLGAPGVSPSSKKTERTATHPSPILIPGSPLNLQDQECQRRQVEVAGEEEPRGSHEGTVRLGVPTQVPCLSLGLPLTPWLPRSACTSAHGGAQDGVGHRDRAGAWGAQSGGNRGARRLGCAKWKGMGTSKRGE